MRVGRARILKNKLMEELEETSWPEITCMLLHMCTHVCTYWYAKVFVSVFMYLH